ncbi:MAG: DEAD/DEAH box helicase [Methanobrevibacter sp.]|jgi:Fanconi anemia group M protein|nr:DEAD/DEAH box helicase [Methanobrevibacter sp.]
MVTYIEHPLIKENTAEARIYQQILAADVLKKGNTMIVAPTALGKTLIAILVAAERLMKIKNSKVLVLAPSKPLTIQHEDNFRNFLKVSCTSITGSVKADDRQKRWDEAQVICATPQTVESDLLNGRYTLKDVSLIVFDECHHAVGSYAYVYLGGRYMNEAKAPLILGLTASPGSDTEKIRHICENLFIENVEIKSEEDNDVKPYFNPIEIDWVKVKMSKEMEKIKEHLDKALKHRLKMLKNINILNTISVGKKDILQARARVQNRIARTAAPPKECFRAISIISAVINIQHSLELLETQGIQPAFQYFEKLKKKNTKAAKGLAVDADFSSAVYLSRQALKYGWEHPKLKKLIEILKEELDIQDKSTVKLVKEKNRMENKENKKNRKKIIVFTHFRDTLNMIYDKCEKEGINTVKFYGQGTSNGEKGLTQKEQKEIIKSFKVGNYDVLISTSVAEEGIDIPSVDLVVLYEPVPSEVRMIQRRGRTGRKDAGRMKVLVTEGTMDEGFYWSSIHKENKMKSQLYGALDELELKPVTPVQSKLIERKDNDLKKIINDLGEESLRSIDEERKKEKAIENEGSIENEAYIKKEYENESSIKSENENEESENTKEITISNKKKAPDKIVVYADSREGNSKVLRALDNLSVEVRIKAMAVGDYQVSNDVAIERKTAKDFVDSIVDKRLYKQSRLMKEEFKKPVMILEGDDFYSGFLNPDAIRGSIASIAIDFGIPIIPTRNPEDTAAMIKRIAIREQSDGSSPIQIRTERKPVNTWEQQLFIVESLPHIGPVSAKKLLERFATVKDIVNASQSQLQEVDGIGKKTAEDIKNILTKKYLHFKEDSENKKLI